jgi:hypothetical protein
VHHPKQIFDTYPNISKAAQESGFFTSIQKVFNNPYFLAVCSFATSLQHPEQIFDTDPNNGKPKKYNIITQKPATALAFDVGSAPSKTNPKHSFRYW